MDVDQLRPWLSRILYIALGFGLKVVLDTDFSTGTAKQSTRAAPAGNGGAVNTTEELKMVLVSVCM